MSSIERPAHLDDIRVTVPCTKNGARWIAAIVGSALAFCLTDTSAFAYATHEFVIQQPAEHQTHSLNGFSTATQSTGLNRSIYLAEGFIPGPGPELEEVDLEPAGVVDKPRETIDSVLQQLLDRPREIGDSEPEAVLDKPKILVDSEPDTVLDKPKKIVDSEPEAVLDKPKILGDSEPEAVVDKPKILVDSEPGAVVDKPKEIIEKKPEEIVDLKPDEKLRKNFLRSKSSGFDLALKYQQLGDLESAISLHRKAIKDDPTHESAFNYLALCLIERKANGDWDEAKEMLSQAQHLSEKKQSSMTQSAESPENDKNAVPSTAAATNAGTPFTQGLASEQSGDLQKAADLYQQTISQQPLNLIVIKHLFDLHIQMGNQDKARKLLKRSILAAPPAEHMKILYEALTNLDKKSPVETQTRANANKVE
ncbi:MAG: tetratricopeptide repeat protein [Candidatus Melainabacteria bacterium]|nr:tetratricopeptide repeat protein [Candidatus Melainabacteria bacterium]